MIKLEHTETFNWEAAIRGMRNPMNSWEMSDSQVCAFEEEELCNDLWKDRRNCGYPNHRSWCIGKNDLDLMKKLAKAGSDHRKYMRQIFVSVDITAPLYWWKEFDTYKVGTVANSCSTMHKIHERPLTLHDFSHEYLEPEAKDVLLCVIQTLNALREYYCDFKNKGDWYQMIQLLPSSYNQKRTITMNYENLVNMYPARKNHKLDEWHVFCDWIESLPYSEIITEVKKDGESQE